MAAGIDTRPYIEIYDGVVRLKVPPSPYHCVVQPRLAEIMRRKAGDRGFVMTELHVRIGATDGADTLYLPDICYVRAERADAIAGNAIPRFTPDIVVEIRSPDELAHERACKIARYLSCGAALVLDVDPDERLIIAHDETGVRRFTLAEELRVATFPWLRFHVAEAFIDRDRLERRLQHST